MVEGTPFEARAKASQFVKGGGGFSSRCCMGWLHLQEQGNIDLVFSFFWVSFRERLASSGEINVDGGGAGCFYGGFHSWVSFGREWRVLNQIEFNRKDREKQSDLSICYLHAYINTQFLFF